jgi:beta-glucosidase-like glycosyl hydrolase
MKKTWSFIGFLLFLTILIGFSRYFVVPTYFPQLIAKDEPLRTLEPSPTPVVEEDLNAEQLEQLEIASRSAVLLQKLTPRQKVAQLVAFPISGTASDSTKTRTSQLEEIPGIFTLTGKTISALEADQAVAYLQNLSFSPEINKAFPELTDKERILLRPLAAIDHEGGTVQRLKGEGMTIIPSAEEQCKLSKEELNVLLSRTAKELKAAGVNIVYAPVVDLASNHPVLKTRICSDDVDVVRDYGEQWILALEAQNITPVIKHYPGIGQTTKDLHTNPDRVEFNPVEHSVFVSLLAKYPLAGVMTSHVVVGKEDEAETNLDRTVLSTKGLPCTLSPECLSRLPDSPTQLRFTDALEMVSARGFDTAGEVPTLEDLSVQAIRAGHTVLVFDSSVQPEEVNKIITRLSDEYQRSAEFRKSVDQSVTKVLRKKSTSSKTK